MYSKQEDATYYDIFGLPCTLGSSSRNLGSEVKISDADESANNNHLSQVFIPSCACGEFTMSKKNNNKLNNVIILVCQFARIPPIGFKIVMQLISDSI